MVAQTITRNGIDLQITQLGPAQFSCVTAGNVYLATAEIEGKGITEKFAVNEWFKWNDLSLRIAGAPIFEHQHGELF